MTIPKIPIFRMLILVLAFIAKVASCPVLKPVSGWPAAAFVVVGDPHPIIHALAEADKGATDTEDKDPSDHNGAAEESKGEGEAFHLASLPALPRVAWFLMQAHHAHASQALPAHVSPRLRPPTDTLARLS